MIWGGFPTYFRKGIHILLCVIASKPAVIHPPFSTAESVRSAGFRSQEGGQERGVQGPFGPDFWVW